MLVFAGYVRLAGTGNAAGLLLTKLTISPPGGALAFRTTVPVTACPEVAFNGLKLNVIAETTGGLIVRMLDFTLALSVAEMVAVVCVPTGAEITANDALVVPAGTVIAAGTTALVLVLVSATAVPPATAGPPSVTVPVA